MISSLYVDNYRCFSNFSWRPDRVNLLLGENGTGKSSVFDLLLALREIITKGEPVESAFPFESLCIWRRQSDAFQRFTLSVEGNGGVYEYVLIIEHELPDGVKNRIKSETLFFNNQHVYEFDGRELHLYRDDATAGPVFPFSWSRSGMATVPARNDNTRLTWFRDFMGAVQVFSPDPLNMRAIVKKPVDNPEPLMHDFAAWLHAVQSADFQVGLSLAEHLRETIRGFVKHRFIKAGSNAWELFAGFEFRDEHTRKITNSFELSFEALSTGQRNLFALYTILHAAVKQGATLCIDEPDNFVALREIQPWLSAIQDAAEEKDCQILIVSHHPELINQLAAHSGVLFERDATGATMSRRFEWKDKELMTPAELVARGWE
jgi:ABC-type cobalamin/Fe3+-siderophores transport system ATPase subunit